MLNDNSSQLRNNELKSFVKLRSKRTIKRGRISYENVPVNKEKLIQRCFELRCQPCSKCLYSAPIYPILLQLDSDFNNNSLLCCISVYER